MDPKKENPGGGGGGGPAPPRPDCVKCFDALWFCYSPYYQLQNYYRHGEFDNCFGKWGDLVDCLWLKTRRAAEAEEILAAREKARPHIWTYRTVDEASDNWLRMYGHLVGLGGEDGGGGLVRVITPPSAAAVPRPATFPGLAAAATAAVPRPPPFTGAGAAPSPPKSGGS
ncbi:uncharacterized protein [Oryza sativa Japonica Group]|jgi:Zn-finger protein|uniref:Os09g0516800 protein n=3 Tax=Oryza sativa TaxID=4530 RepID=Q0J0C6_ORYSJ|nr:uncharacterized protein LOC4347583 [Oryza sativa Japonica Group]XP_015612490.1 uncharacterized protein LOC4347583 [Oryza sativa Japonica Group]EAZ09760.1 hypothetical protein OsI_32048 [Oryza sativa Indica Group]KAF2917073.1 hypothetical protein DAI22_09g165700 [Oryza sativa Japonica Group]BAD33827.1 hypothetical protein [Oryza sativa Japonica Group]BAF25589.1 Os09g0516800 [Oryza sativa Japonica Group]BAT08970.1 Os09g0516800 [Oryza sativa Japonica Group]|eukprot:NP_001063675.1 Os09g0516800 [Oryza sativa Japonica Group]